MTEQTGRQTAERAGGAAVPTPSLVERDQALSVIAAALDAARAGAGRLVVIEGEAGVGKSRLLAEAARMAADRLMDRQFARGTSLERGYAFGLMRRLLDRPLSGVDAGELAGLQRSGAAPAIELLLGTGLASPPPDALFALVNAFYRLYLRLTTDAPLLVVVDDLHWADAGSARALAHLASRVEELPLALIVAIRSGEALEGPDPRAALGESAAAAGLRVEALSEAASGRLLESLLGGVAPQFAAAAHRATGGNPFLLTELALTIAREGVEPDAEGAASIAGTVPEAVRGWAERRLGALGEQAGRLARSLAVLEQADILVAAEHAGLEPEAARAAADQLAGAGLTASELPLRFAHPLIRSALYEGTPPAARDQAHHEAASVLARRGAGDEAVASHLLEAEPRGERWAVEALRAAAAAALARGAAEQAATVLARAAAEPRAGDDAALLAELGRARAALSDPRALADLERAVARATEPITRIGALAALAQARYLAGDIHAAFDLAGRALAEIRPGVGGPVEAELLLGYLMAGRQSPQLLEPVRRALASPRAGPGSVAGPAEVVRRQVVGLDAFLRGDRDAAAASSGWVAERLAAQPPGDELPPLLAIGPAFVLSGLGDWEAAEAVIAAALERAGPRGSPLETAECLHERIWHRWRRGLIVGGLADIETVLELTAGAWDPAKVPMRVAEAHLLLERGRLGDAAEALTLPAEIERALPGTWGWPWLAIGRAVVALARGEPEQALEMALEGGERLAEIDASSPEYAPWRSLAAVAAARAGDPERGRELAADELARGEAIGAPRARGTALAALAEVGPPGERIETLRAAVAALDEARADLHRARARLDLGMALRRARHPREAREPLREALDLGHRLGSTQVGELAMTELRAAGARPRRRRASGVGALTPRELEIATLAAEGRGNVDIAERLFITRKTVEGHLRTVFRKLEISSREEIPERLRR